MKLNLLTTFWYCSKNWYAQSKHTIITHILSVKIICRPALWSLQNKSCTKLVNALVRVGYLENSHWVEIHHWTGHFGQPTAWLSCLNVLNSQIWELSCEVHHCDGWKVVLGEPGRAKRFCHHPWTKYIMVSLHLPVACKGKRPTKWNLRPCIFA